MLQIVSVKSTDNFTVVAAASYSDIVKNNSKTAVIVLPKSQCYSISPFGHSYSSVESENYGKRWSAK